MWRRSNRSITLPRGRARCRHVRCWTWRNSPILWAWGRWILGWGLRPIGGGWAPIVRRGCVTCDASKTWAQAERRPNLARKQSGAI